MNGGKYWAGQWWRWTEADYWLMDIWLSLVKNFHWSFVFEVFVLKQTVAPEESEEDWC